MHALWLIIAPQKADPSWVCITAGGNLIDCKGELITCTANVTTAKLLWNSTLSTPHTKFMDIKNFTLVHHWTELKTWKCFYSSSQTILYSNTSLTNMQKRDMSILRFVKPSMACPKHVSCPKNSYGKIKANWILKSCTHPWALVS